MIFDGEYLDGLMWNGIIHEPNNINNLYELKDGNGFIKEYNLLLCKLIFEGYYLNGKRNGEGKEYDYEGRLKFEGEYLNGERNGKGKEYNFTGEILYEGEYKNGLRNGKGTEYHFTGGIRYEDEYKNGKRNGKGREYLDNKLIYEGEYFNGKKNLTIKIIFFSFPIFFFI